MANYQGHLLGGLCTFAGIFMMMPHYIAPVRCKPWHIIFWLCLCLCGALFPDIDIHSMGQKLLYRLLLLGMLISIYLGCWQALPFLAIATIFPFFVSHRGLTHSFWFVTLAPLAAPVSIALMHKPMTTFALASYFFFVGGALSHLILDFGVAGLFKRTLGIRSRARRKRR